MNQIKEIYQKAPLLFHYTTLSYGLCILKDENIRAYHPSTMNDLSEYKFALDLISEIADSKNDTDFINLMKIPEYLNRTGYKSGEQIKQIFGLLGEERYICSFSQRKDINGQLSMWRNYAGDGIAFEIDTKRLWDGLSNSYVGTDTSALVMDVVMYEKLKKPSKQIIAAYTDLKVFLSKVFNKVSPDQSVETFEKLLKVIIAIAFLYKHKAFKEEKEVRVGVINQALDLTNTIQQHGKHQYVGEPKFKVGWSIKNSVGSAKYIELPFGRDCIKKIVVGPGLLQKSNEFTLRKEYPDIEIYLSNIPHI